MSLLEGDLNVAAAQKGTPAALRLENNSILLPQDKTIQKQPPQVKITKADEEAEALYQMMEAECSRKRKLLEEEQQEAKRKRSAAASTLTKRATKKKSLDTGKTLVVPSGAKSRYWDLDNGISLVYEGKGDPPQSLYYVEATHFYCAICQEEFHHCPGSSSGMSAHWKKHEDGRLPPPNSTKGSQKYIRRCTACLNSNHAERESNAFSCVGRWGKGCPWEKEASESGLPASKIDSSATHGQESIGTPTHSPPKARSHQSTSTPKLSPKPSSTNANLPTKLVEASSGRDSRQPQKYTEDSGRMRFIPVGVKSSYWDLKNGLSLVYQGDDDDPPNPQSKDANLYHCAICRKDFRFIPGSSSDMARHWKRHEDGRLPPPNLSSKFPSIKAVSPAKSSPKKSPPKPAIKDGHSTNGSTLFLPASSRQEYWGLENGLSLVNPHGNAPFNPSPKDVNHFYCAICKSQFKYIHRQTKLIRHWRKHQDGILPEGKERIRRCTICHNSGDTEREQNATECPGRWGKHSSCPWTKSNESNFSEAQKAVGGTNETAAGSEHAVEETDHSSSDIEVDNLPIYDSVVTAGRNDWKTVRESSDNSEEEEPDAHSTTSSDVSSSDSEEDDMPSSLW